MNALAIEMVPIDNVTVPDGRRQLRRIDELAASIQEIGLLSPIRVTP